MALEAGSKGTARAFERATQPAAADRDRAALHRGRALLAGGRWPEAEEVFATAEALDGDQAFADHLTMRGGELRQAYDRLDESLASLSVAERADLAQGNRHHRSAKPYASLEILHARRGDQGPALIAGKRPVVPRLEGLSPRASRCPAEALGDSWHRAQLAAERRGCEKAVAEVRAAVERSRRNWLALTAILPAGTQVLVARRQPQSFRLNRARTGTQCPLGAQPRAQRPTSHPSESGRDRYPHRCRLSVSGHCSSRGVAPGPARLPKKYRRIPPVLDHVETIDDRQGHQTTDLAFRQGASLTAGMSPIPLAASIGFVHLAAGEVFELDRFLRAADRAIYTAKEGGRG